LGGALGCPQQWIIEAGADQIGRNPGRFLRYCALGAFCSAVPAAFFPLQGEGRSAALAARSRIDIAWGQNDDSVS